MTAPRKPRPGKRIVDRFVSAYPAGVPEWVLQFGGPFREHSLQKVAEEFFEEDPKLNLMRWADRYMSGGQSNIVVPTMRFDADRLPRLEFMPSTC